jgi:hypothetical protein
LRRILSNVGGNLVQLSGGLGKPYHSGCHFALICRTTSS